MLAAPGAGSSFPEAEAGVDTVGIRHETAGTPDRHQGAEPIPG